MKTKFSFGTALLLPAVFFLHPIALCAAGVQAESARAHGCCHKAPEQESPEAPCCRISSLPAPEGIAELVAMPALPELPVTGEVSGKPLFEETTSQTVLFEPPPFFIQFHQLLI